MRKILFNQSNSWVCSLVHQYDDIHCGKCLRSSNNKKLSQWIVSISSWDWQIKNTLGRNLYLLMTRKLILVIVKFTELGLPIVPWILLHLVHKYCELNNKDYPKTSMKHLISINITKKCSVCEPGQGREV